MRVQIKEFAFYSSNNVQILGYLYIEVMWVLGHWFSINLSFFGLLPFSLSTLFLLLNLLLQFHCSLFDQLVTRLASPSVYLGSFPTAVLFSQNMHPTVVDSTVFTLASCDRGEHSFAFEALVLFGSVCVELFHYLIDILLFFYLLGLLLFFSFVFLLLFLGL